MRKFIIPFYYTFYTRIKGKSKRIAYIFTFILPIYIYIFGFYRGFDIKDFLGSIVAFIGLMSVYEIGYINNDVLTIKKEDNPTLRLTWEEIFYAEKNIAKIKFIKYIIAFVAVAIIEYLKLNAVYYIVSLILIDFVYLIHNTVRDKKTIASFFFLSLLRYIAVPVVFCYSKSFNVSGLDLGKSILLFILIIALPRTIEKAAEKKYNIVSLNIIKDKTTEFRVIYYVVISLIGVGLLSFGYSYLVLALYYLAYRVLILLGFYIRERKRV